MDKKGGVEADQISKHFSVVKDMEGKKKLIDIGFCLWLSLELEITFWTVLFEHWTI